MSLPVVRVDERPLDAEAGLLERTDRRDVALVWVGDTRRRLWPREHDVGNEAAEDLRTEPPTRQVLLADKDVGSGRSGVGDPDQLSVRRIVCDEVGLEHADGQSIEQHEVVVGRVGALDRREIVRHDVLVRPPLGVPAADVRALEPFVEQPEVVGHHRPERELGGQSHESKIG